MRTAPRSLAFLFGLFALTLGCAEHPVVAPKGRVPLDDRSGAAESDGEDFVAAEAPIQEEALSAAARGWADFFPLAPNNFWRYEGQIAGWLTPTGGTREPLFAEPIETSMSRRVVGTANLGDRDYWILRDIRASGGSLDVAFDYPVRQDRTGLYELEVVGRRGSRTDVAPTAAGGRERPLAAEVESRLLPAHAGRGLAAVVLALLERTERLRSASFSVSQGAPSLDPSLDLPERRLLAYPLHRGRHWLIYSDGARSRSTGPPCGGICFAGESGAGSAGGFGSTPRSTVPTIGCSSGMAATGTSVTGSRPSGSPSTRRVHPSELSRSSRPNGWWNWI
jgi:hypothetical protein